MEISLSQKMKRKLTPYGQLNILKNNQNTSINKWNWYDCV